MTTKTAQFTPPVNEVMAHYNLSDDAWDCLSIFTKQKLATMYIKHAAAPAMYEALKTLQSILKPDAPGYAQSVQCQQVEAALAQAEGRHHE